ncbi:MAG: CBS domain-containing protein [Anaerolineaceae bacterium]|jgi:CBS domain-containing protein
MLTIADILRTKGNTVYFVEKGTSLLEALEMMSNKGIGALMVMEAGEPVGIFSERDFARMVAREKKADLSTPVEEMMTRNIYCVTREDTIDEAMAVMTRQRFRHMPVREGKKIIGIISIGDVVKNLIEDKDFLIRNMEDYILGRGYGQ